VTRIAIAGVGGRMGQALVQAVADHPQASLGAGSEREGSVLVGQSLGGGEGSVQVVADLAAALDNFDVLIDFTRPEATVAHAALCRAHGKRLVVGTTGLGPDQEAELRAAAEAVPVVYAPNMSVGVNLTFKLVELAARVLGDSVDIEIVEAHHRHKIDAPSGTALRLGRIVADTLGGIWRPTQSTGARAVPGPVSGARSDSPPSVPETSSASTPPCLPPTASGSRSPTAPAAA